MWYMVSYPTGSERWSFAVEAETEQHACAAVVATLAASGHTVPRGAKMAVVTLNGAIQQAPPPPESTVN